MVGYICGFAIMNVVLKAYPVSSYNRSGTELNSLLPRCTLCEQSLVEPNVTNVVFDRHPKTSDIFFQSYIEIMFLIYGSKTYISTLIPVEIMFLITLTNRIL